MTSLLELRKKIDQIDQQLLSLFEQRMALSLEVAKNKKSNATPVANPAREAEILETVSDTLSPQIEGYGRILYHTIFDVSRSYQNLYLSRISDLGERIQVALTDTPKIFPKKAMVACQGIEGSYSEAACKKLFAQPKTLFFNQFKHVFEAVDKGMCQYGILPLENSSYGSVGPVYDLMRNYNFHIVRSVRLRVSHQLLARPGVSLDQIKEILSHDQAIGQCGEFLSGLNQVKVTSCENTATAARLVSESSREDLAAIASKECATLYGLSPLAHNIQDESNNYTRFICISKKLELYPGSSKISLMLSVPHEPTSLYHLIAKFSCLGLNLTKLESRPIPGSDFEFMFYFDLDASIYADEVIKLLSELEASPEIFVFLGSYSEVI